MGTEIKWETGEIKADVTVHCGIREKQRKARPPFRDAGFFFAMRGSGLAERFRKRRLIFLHRGDVSVLGGVVGLASDDGVEGVDFRAGLPGDGLGGVGGILRLGKENLHRQRVYLFNRLLQLGGGGFAARLPLDDGHDVEAEFLREVGESLMEGHDVFMGQVVESGVHFLFQGFQFLDVGRGVLLIRVGVLGVGGGQLVGDVFHLSDGVGDAEPDVRVLFVAVLEERNVFGSVDDFKVLLLADHLVQEGFHARAVDDESVGFFQRLEVAGGELVVMEAARLRFGHVRHFDAVDALGNVDGGDVHGIEGRDNAKGRFGFLVISAAAASASAAAD